MRDIVGGSVDTGSCGVTINLAICEFAAEVAAAVAAVIVADVAAAFSCSVAGGGFGGVESICMRMRHQISG